MYKIRDDVKLTSMKKIGVITVDERNLYRDVQSYISKKDITPTDFFYDKIKKSTYHAGENPILSYRDDSNLVVAKKDSDAIFLYSENQILSPTQLINIFVNLYDAAQSASLELESKIYANFDISDLNINFVDMILATGATTEFMQEYDNNFKKFNNSDNIYGSELNGVKSVYNPQDEVVLCTYSSQYGMNVIKFLDTMINLDPDVRLLMSNTAISPYKTTLIDTLLKTIKNNYDSYRNYSDMEIARDVEEVIKSGQLLDSKEKEQFFEAFRKEREKSDYRISKSNNSYKVFPALKYVLNLQQKGEQESDDLDTRYVLRWYDGDPDNGQRAINHALSVMSSTIRTEREPSLVSCRNMQEVKNYMEKIKNKALELNMKSKKKEIKNKEYK